MEQTIIRECVIDDAAALFVLNKEEMGYDFPIEQTRKRLKEVLADGKNKVLQLFIAGRLSAISMPVITM